MPPHMLNTALVFTRTFKSIHSLHTSSCIALSSVLLELRRSPLLPLIQPLPPSTSQHQISSEQRCYGICRCQKRTSGLYGARED